MRNYILKDGQPVPEPDILAFASWYETAERHLADEEALPGVRVSTVFLAIDHNWSGGPPVLWETMVFGEDSPWDQFQFRYSTADAALVGHRLVVAAIKAGTAPDDVDIP